MSPPARRKLAIKASDASIHQLLIKALTLIEKLPIEILQNIFLLSLNPNLTSISPELARKLNSDAVRRKLVCLAFWRYGSPAEYLEGKDPMVAERISLLHHITDQTWFSAGLVYSCLKEYLSKILPPAFKYFLEDGLQWKTNPSLISRQHLAEGLPPWIVELPSSHGSDQQTSLTTGGFFRKPLLPASSKTWHSYNASRVYIAYRTTRVGGTDKPFFFTWAMMEQDIELEYFQVSMTNLPNGFEPNPRLFNPKTWTEDDLALLITIMHPFTDDLSDEIMDAMSAGLMKAISQKFVPAVFTASSIWRDMDWEFHGFSSLAKHILDHARERAEYGDDSTSTTWILERLPKTPFITHNNVVFQAWSQAITTEHLIRAMEILCEPVVDVASYYIFCWLSLITIDIIPCVNNGPHLEDIVKKISDLAATAGTEYAFEGARYFKSCVANWRVEMILNVGSESTGDGDSTGEN